MRRRFRGLEFAEFAIAFGVALATAAGSLALELAVWPDVRADLWAPRQVVFVLGALAGLGVAGWGLSRRRKILREHGTLYYVRMLHSGMRDYHTDELTTLFAEHQDVRAVTQWVADNSTGQQGVDYTAEVRHVDELLEAAMNDDQVDSSYTIVPNLLWPFAFALGSYHHLLPNTRLLEPKRTHRQGTFSQVTVTRADLFPTTAETPAPPSPLVKRAYAGPDPDGATVLSLDITGYADVPRGFETCGISLLLRAADRACTARAKTAAASGNNATPAKRHPGRDNLPICVETQADHQGDDAKRWHYVPPGDIINACVDAIRQTIRDNPNTMVILSPRVSKVVAMGIGLRLAVPEHRPSCGDPLDCQVDACTRPWKWLVTINYDPRTDTHRYYRVHDDQPSVERVAQVLRDASAS